MKKLEASMRDNAAKGAKMRRAMYRVGSYFKGCCNCGDTIMVETASGREVKRYTSGYDVYRAYQPSWTKFTYWCYQCGAKDLACWEDAIDIGRDAICGSRDAVRAVKAAFKKSVVGNGKAAAVSSEEVARAAKIAKLEAEVAALVALIKK
jgi:hypothetical protein